MATTTRTAPTHYIYCHKGATAQECKIIRRFTADEVFKANRAELMIRGFLLRACECGKGQYGHGVVGKVKPEETCGAKCRSSKGPSCECSCGGEHHGANY